MGGEGPGIVVAGVVVVGVVVVKKVLAGAPALDGVEPVDGELALPPSLHAAIMAAMGIVPAPMSDHRTRSRRLIEFPTPAV